MLTTSAEVWLLSRIAELAVRCGVHPCDAAIDLEIDDGKEVRESAGQCVLWIVGEGNVDNEAVNKVYELLGFDGDIRRFKGGIREAADAVEKALSLAPRPRSR